MALSGKWPVWPTVIVAAACATMFALGFWQLHRAKQRDLQGEIYQANSRDLALVAYPRVPPVADGLLYRRSSVICLNVGGWQASGGTARDGTRGFRQIAQCRTGAEGPGALIDVGVSTSAQFQPRWNGGVVTGRITLMPSEGGLLGQLLGGSPPQPLLVSERAAPGLMVSAAPDPTTQGNSSWAYAVQWFFFAFSAGVIYWLALRRRWHSAEVAAPPRAS
jgi:surfeit locus 1 family protein